MIEYMKKNRANQCYKSLETDRIQERLRKKGELIFEKRTKLQVAQGLRNLVAERKQEQQRKHQQ